MKFAIWLLLIISIVSLLSMFAVEFIHLDTNIPNWEKVYSAKYGKMLPLMNFLHLQNPYRSWWYQILLGALTLSLAMCIIDRFPSAIRKTFGVNFAFTIDTLKSLANVQTFKSDKSFFDKVKGALKSYKIHKQETEGAVLISADRAKIGNLGILAIHLGLFLLIVGAIWALWGESFWGSGFPGDYIESDKFDFKARVDDFRIEYYHLGVGQWVLADEHHLGKVLKKLPGDIFLVEFFDGRQKFTQEMEARRLRNKFNIEADRGNISDYVCQLTIIEGDSEVMARQIEVNKPLRYKGFRFYQNSFDSNEPKVTAEVDSIAIGISQAGEEQISDTVWLSLGNKFPVSKDLEAQASDFLPDFRLSGSNAISASEELRNPAVKLTLFKGDEELGHQWLFLRHRFHSRITDSPYDYQLLELANPRADIKYRTILEIKTNQGGTVIWIGIILCSLGVILTFYITPRYVQAVVKAVGGGYEVVIGGFAPRAKFQFENEFKRIIEKLK
jgi:cytochrome c biogenesis protein